MSYRDECCTLQVTQVKTREKEGYTALQLGAGSKRDKQLSGSELGHFRAASVPPKREVVEFRVSSVSGTVPHSKRTGVSCDAVN
jgi:large subunit ribosomal protein L3